MDVPKGVAVEVRVPPDPDGTQWVVAEVNGIGPCLIAFPEDASVDFVATMQKGFVDRRYEMIRPPQFPQLTVTGVNLAHGNQGQTALLVATDSWGQMALMASPEMLDALKVEIDRLLQQMSSKDRPN
jgi:hypothetical protein